MFSDEGLGKSFEDLGRVSNDQFLNDVSGHDVGLATEESHSNRVPMRSFWKSVIAFEKAPHTTHFDQLLKAGIHLPEPRRLDDLHLAEKLWEVIHALASLRIYLRHTDHLSNRQLYELLWWDLLRQETVDTTMLPDTNCHLDILGDGNDESRYLYLMYYADEQERRFWSEQYPDADLPYHVEPPFTRDTALPQEPV